MQKVIRMSNTGGFSMKQSLKLYELQCQETTNITYQVHAVSREEAERLAQAGQAVVIRWGHKVRRIMTISELGLVE